MNLKAILLSATLLAPVAVHAQSADLTGRVADVFSNQFVLEADGQRLLVTPAEGTDIPAQGEIVAVTGTRDGAEFAATGIRAVTRTASATEGDLPEGLQGLGLTDLVDRNDDDGERRIGGRLADGTQIKIEYDRQGNVDEAETNRDGALPAAFLTDILPAALIDTAEYKGIARVTEVEIDRDEISVEGFAEDGAKVEIESSPQGVVHSYERKMDRDRRAVDSNAARQGLEQLGYTDAGSARTDDGNTYVEATNPEGERVELRLDEQGRITRERATN